MNFLNQAHEVLYTAVICILVLMVFVCLIRAIRGPRIADRIIAINMMGTMVMVIIAVMSLLLKEGYLLDISLIYAMISFLAVVILTKIYLGVYTEREIEEEKQEELSALEQKSESIAAKNNMTEKVED